MKDNQTIYIRGKIHWWVLLILWGFYVWAIIAYIHQWGNNPVNEAALTILAIIWIMVSVLLFAERFILTIDEKFIVVKFGSIWNIKIHISQIKDAHVLKVNFWIYFWTYVKKMPNKGTQYIFDFTRRVVKIQTNSGSVYQIAIKDAQKIKEEIEKRMLTANY
jgi:hypothetical protein